MTAVIANPNRQRRSPIAVAAQRPVDIVFEPITKAAVFNMAGIPVDALIQLHQPVLKLTGTDIPGGTRHIQQWCTAAPAERIGVFDLAMLQHAATRNQFFDDQWIRILDKKASPWCDFRNKFACAVHCHQQREIFPFSDFVVFCAERWSNMNQTGTVFSRHIIRQDNAMCRFFKRQETIQRFVTPSFQITAFISLKNFYFFAWQNNRNERFRHDQFFSGTIFFGTFNFDIGDIRMRSDTDICRKCPRCRRPHQKVRIRLIDQLQTEINRWILSFLITLSDLMIGKRRPAARTIWYHFKSLV